MDLYIKDRIIFPTIFPEMGTFNEYSLKKNILQKISISEEEKEAIGLKTDEKTGHIHWDPAKDVPLAVDFSQDECEYIQALCQDTLNQDKRYGDEIWDVISKLHDNAVAVLSAKKKKK